MYWDRVLLEDYLIGKEERSVDINEYLMLIRFLDKIKPEIIIDIGTYLGASAYILSKCCKKTYTIDNINSPEYYEKPESPKEEHGKYIDKSNTTFLTKGYDNGIFDNLIKMHPDAFVFWDAGKNTYKVLLQLELSYKNKVKYIAVHDSGRKQRTVRRALMRANQLNWYKTIEEDVDSCPKKGLTILELVS